MQWVDGYLLNTFTQLSDSLSSFNISYTSNVLISFPNYSFFLCTLYSFQSHLKFLIAWPLFSLIIISLSIYASEQNFFDKIYTYTPV